MKKEYYILKKNINWRKERDSFLFLYLQERRLLIFNKRIANSISPNGVIESNKDNSVFINFLKKLKAIRIISKPTRASFLPAPSRNISAPLNVTIQITNKCNLNCIHCHNNKEKSKKVLPFNKYKELIDELRKLKVFNINLSGGEPLLVPNIVDVVRYTIDKGINCTMSSNLTLLNKRTAVNLSEAGLKRMHVSLDSFNPSIHNRIRGTERAFERMKENLHLLKENGIEYTFVTTLINQSVFNYGKTIDLAYQLGARTHKTNTLILLGRASSFKSKYATEKEKEKMKKYIEVWKKKKLQYKGKMSILAETMFSIQIGKEAISDPKAPQILRDGCPAGTLTCAIIESGDVTPCSSFTEIALGNIFKDKFVDIWNSLAMKNFRNRQNIKICGDCRYRDNCGGCRARSYGIYGSLQKDDPLCFKVSE